MNKFPFIKLVFALIIISERRASERLFKANGFKINVLLRTVHDIELIQKENIKMASNKIVVPEAKQALDQFKMQAANEVGVNLNNGYNGDITSRQAGSVGGQMVKKMIEKYENDLKSGK